MENRDSLVAVILMGLMYIGTTYNVIYHDIQLKRYQPKIIVKHVHDTITITDTLVKYRDTCDSNFFRTIGEVEQGLKTFSRQNPDYYKVKVDGEGKLGKGHFGIYEICLKGTGFHKSLGYTHDDMYNFEKSGHVFWAMMGIQSYRFRRKYNRNPTYEELARMWAGGFNAHNKQCTIRYLNKFKKSWQK